MQKPQNPRGLTRRELLASGVKAGAVLVIGSSFIAHTTDSWALETNALKPDTLATLVQMARDIYPHDTIADKYYAIAVKAHDTKAAEDDDHRTMIEDGVASLNAIAAARGHQSYLATGWEAERVDILRELEDGTFFQTIRGGLVVGLYNQKDIWPVFGYEGESFSKGGYVNRGFDDVNWL